MICCLIRNRVREKGKPWETLDSVGDADHPPDGRDGGVPIHTSEGCRWRTARVALAGGGCDAVACSTMLKR